MRFCKKCGNPVGNKMPNQAKKKSKLPLILGLSLGGVGGIAAIIILIVVFLIPKTDFTLSEYLEDKGESVWFNASGERYFMYTDEDKIDEIVTKDLRAGNPIVIDHGKVYGANVDITDIGEKLADYIGDLDVPEDTSWSKKYFEDGNIFKGVTEMDDDLYDKYVKRCQEVQEVYRRNYPKLIDEYELIEPKVVETDNSGNNARAFGLYAMMENTDEKIAYVREIIEKYADKKGISYADISEKKVDRYVVKKIMGDLCEDDYWRFIEIEPIEIRGGYYCGFIFARDEDGRGDDYASIWLTRVDNPNIRIHMDPVNKDMDIVDPDLSDYDEDDIADDLLDRMGLKNEEITIIEGSSDDDNIWTY